MLSVKRVGFGIILTAAVFTCIEISTRLFIKPPPIVVIEDLNGPDDSGYESLYYGLYVKTPTGLRLRRNTRVTVKNLIKGPDIEIKTNSLGFRNEELQEKGRNDFRIFVLGDSITLSDYLPEGQTYPRRIAEYLKPAIGANAKRKYEVINGGVGAVDLQTEYAVLLERGLKVKPDVVLLELYLNDACYSPAIKVALPPSICRASYFLRVLFDRINKLRAFYRVYELSHNMAFEKERNSYFGPHKKLADGSIAFRNEFEKNIYNNFDDWGNAWSQKYWEKILPLIDMMKQTAGDEKFRLAVVFFPVAYQITDKGADKEPQERFAREMSKRNIPSLDLLPILKEKYDRGGANLFYDQCHYTEEGNDFVGKNIAEFLKQTVLKN